VGHPVFQAVIKIGQKQGTNSSEQSFALELVSPVPG
jgi:hypothetical protein